MESRHDANFMISGDIDSQPMWAPVMDKVDVMTTLCFLWVDFSEASCSTYKWYVHLYDLAPMRLTTIN